MYLVAGVTGNTGAAVAESLLAGDAKIRVLVRSADRAEAWRARGAEVAVGRLDDEAALTAALEGTRGAYLLSPPDYAAADQLADRRRYTAVFARAVARSGVPHVVVLSSIGAQHPDGTGIISSLHELEERLRPLGVPVTVVRAAYFVENFAGVLGPVRSDGVLPAFFAPGKAIPMVSTRDIGRVAAEALRTGPRGWRVLELSGPRELSHEDVARTLGRLVGREVRAVELPAEARAGALRAAGLNEDTARLFVEMNDGIASGRVDWERAGAEALRGVIEPEETLARLLAAG